jgi:rhomboid family GlyGly-CTERM serine protease
MGLHAGETHKNLQQCLAVAAVIAVAAIFIQIGGDGVRDSLAFSRADLDTGQLWRFITGHFVHLGWSHLFLNLAGLALVAYLVGNTFDCFKWVFIAFVSIVTIDAGFWFLNPELDWYVGLSGLLHGLLAAGLLVGVLQLDRESIVLAVFVLAKLAWEQISGPLPGSEASSGGVVIVDAHLYGALGGLLAAVLLRRRVKPAAPI